jgi:hypothetical protein
MSRPIVLIALILVASVCCIAGSLALAGESYPPQAPSSVSWLPHGYGGSMWVSNSLWNRKKCYYGFRSVPEHTGAYSLPLWGWDVNGFYLGPQVPEKDPVVCQLPIGLIYPEHGPPLPPQPRRKRIHK